MKLGQTVRDCNFYEPMSGFTQNDHNPFDEIANNSNPFAAFGFDDPPSQSSTPASGSTRKASTPTTAAIKLDIGVTPGTSSPRSSRRRSLSRKNTASSLSSEDAFSAAHLDKKMAAMAIRRGSVMLERRESSGAVLTGVQVDSSDDAGESPTVESKSPSPNGPSSNSGSPVAADSNTPETVLCPNCSSPNEVPEGVTYFNCKVCQMEMVANINSVPKRSRLQCPNCARSIVAPQGSDMFRCVCGQTMVVPGSEMAKRIQRQGTREGEMCFVQEKSEMYGNVLLRVTSKKIFKKWSPRFFSIQHGRLLLFRDKLKAAQGNPAVHSVTLHALQQISDISTTADKKCNLVHTVTIRENTGDGLGNLVAFSESAPACVAAELACEKNESAVRLRRKLESIVLQMEKERRRR